MRYLHLTKNGIWHFRYQIPFSYRHLFRNRYEIKKSLRTSCKLSASILALQLELEIRTTISNYLKDGSPALPARSISIDIHKTNNKPQNPRSKSAFECLGKFKQAKSDHVSYKTLEAAYAKCRIVLELLDKDSIKSIRRVDAEEVKCLLNHYPINAKKYKAFNGLVGKKVVEANKSHGMSTLSTESVKDYMQKASSFFEWCVLMEYTDVNPFKGFKFKKTRRDSEAKQAYDKNDLKLLFGTSIHTEQKYLHPHYYWLPLLGNLSGARLNELCQLHTKDVVKHNGIWIIKISDQFHGQRLKNPFSKRFIPIHSKLIELGFIDYVHSISTDLIFPELKLTRDGYGSAASKWFGRFKNKLAFSKGKDFHSFRHTVANELKQRSIPQTLAAELLGHSQQGITYDRYGKMINTSLLVDVVNSLSTEHLKHLKPYIHNK